MAEKQYVVFRLNQEEYGVEITKIREITEYKKNTKVPNTPDFIDGIINLRGNIIPVIDLKRKFHLEQKEFDSSHRIIITQLLDKQVGFIVDDASQVLRIDEQNIDAAPDIILNVEQKFITGIGKVEEKIIIILDLEEILSEKEQTEFQEIQGNFK